VNHTKTKTEQVISTQESAPHSKEMEDKNASFTEVPGYLQETYWWAYLHPNAVRIFERQWLVNSILWGNYKRLRNSVLTEINQQFSGQILQLACVYGDLTENIAAKLSLKGQLDVIDVSQVQLDNAKSKLGERHNLRLLRQDSSSLELPDEKYHMTILFFLLHEQPDHVRRATLSEALRTTQKGGKIIIVDYHKASRWNPLRYLMALVFKSLEPFAESFIAREISDTLSSDKKISLDKKTFFGGLYQKVIIDC
jgi:ubiquinone/menaquinone biosynthesis C-methylase UbiE